jgi:hypothetical protein
MDQATLTPAQAEAVITALRVGNTATEAAAHADVKPAQVYAAARDGQTDILLALAGHDPYAYDAEQILQQAQYVGLMALGFTPTQASRVLFHGDERVKGWRVKRPLFAEVADHARRMNPPELRRRREHRFTPHRVKVFLKALADGLTAIQASEEAGITNAVVYQRRRRDAAFRQAMDEARARAATRAPAPLPRVTAGQWETFERGVQNGMTLRRAALGAGIDPQRIYDRRRTDQVFRRLTDRWRGEPGATLTPRPPAPRTPSASRRPARPGRTPA